MPVPRPRQHEQCAHRRKNHVRKSVALFAFRARQNNVCNASRRKKTEKNPRNQRIAFSEYGTKNNVARNQHGDRKSYCLTFFVVCPILNRERKPDGARRQCNAAARRDQPLFRNRGKQQKPRNEPADNSRRCKCNCDNADDFPDVCAFEMHTGGFCFSAAAAQSIDNADSVIAASVVS